MPTAEQEFSNLILAEFGYEPIDHRIGSAVLWCPDDPVKWIEREFYIPETGKAIVLEPYQRAVLTEAFRRENGNFVYSLVMWGDIKKSAKSTIAAAVVLWLAWHWDWETCRVVGNDLKQASSRTFFYIERALKLNSRFTPHMKLKINHIDIDNQTSIAAIPVDPKGEAGGGDLITCFTELWAAKNEAAQQLWSETTLSPLKFGKSIRFCESYAGFEGESPILENIYDQGVVNGRLLDLGIEGLPVYANDAAKMLVMWNTTPRCSWQSPEYYAQESAVLTDSEFNRIHRNQWANSSDVFVPPEWWDYKCLKADIPPMGEFQQLVIAVDAGISSDCFAIVGGSKHNDCVSVRYSRVWIPPKGGKLDFSDGDDSPEAALKALIATGHVAVIVYDPYQLHDLMTRLRREQGVWTDPFDQGTPRLVADKSLYDMIREGRVWHDGSHADLSQHVKNANRKPEADKLRIVKRTDKAKVDSCVALSMMAATLTRLNV